MFKCSGPENASGTPFVPRPTIIDRDTGRKSERRWQDAVAIARLRSVVNADFRTVGDRPPAKPGRYRKGKYWKTQDRYEYAVTSQSRYVGS